MPKKYINIENLSISEDFYNFINKEVHNFVQNENKQVHNFVIKKSPKELIL